MRADLVIANLRELYTCPGPAPRRGADQNDAGQIAGATLAARDGRIVYAGETAAAPDFTDAQVVDGSGFSAVPGFVDAHTHVVYAGDRRGEMRRRLAGATYQDIAAEGGGILATVRDTRAAGEQDLIASALPRLDEMLRSGTTTAEVKSGYGLTLDDEIKMLRAVRSLGMRQPISLVPTLLGAHEVPAEYRTRRDDYLALIVNEMIPAVAEEALARFCDVFCETGVFTPRESALILEAGVRHGLEPRVHADEFGPSGGALVAARVGAASADHLVAVDEEGMAALAGSSVVATLLPSASLFLKLGRFAPARLFIEHGIPVALGSDVNPGAGYSPAIPFAMTLACFAMGLTFEEALVAATLNAAYSVRCHEQAGSLEPGKQMDAVLVRGPATELLRAGAPAIAAVIKAGRIVHDAR